MCAFATKEDLIFFQNELKNVFFLIMTTGKFVLIYNLLRFRLESQYASLSDTNSQSNT